MAKSRHAYTIRDATIEDMDALLADIRDADRDEVMAFDKDCRKVMRLSYLGSMMCKAVECEDGLLCVLGVSAESLADGDGCPWMLGTKLLETKHKRAILELSPECLRIVRELFPGKLENFVDARNTKSIRWLRWMGFSFDEPVEIGEECLPFFPFSMGGAQCAIQ